MKATTLIDPETLHAISIYSGSVQAFLDRGFVPLADVMENHRRWLFLLEALIPGDPYTALGRALNQADALDKPAAEIYQAAIDQARQTCK